MIMYVHLHLWQYLFHCCQHLNWFPQHHRHNQSWWKSFYFKITPGSWLYPYLLSLKSTRVTLPDLPGPSLGPRWALLDLFGPSLDLLGPASFWDSQQTRLSQKDDQQSPTFKIVQTQPFLETDFFIRGHCAVRIAPPQNVHTWGFSCLACTSESRPPSKI